MVVTFAESPSPRVTRAMPEVFDHPHTVVDDEIDELGHANNVAYVAWLQAAAVAHSGALGWTGERYRQLGFGWVVRSHWIEYLQPAVAGDQIVVQTWVASMRKVTSVRRYRVLRPADQLLLATAETNWAFVNYATGKPTRIVAEIARLFPVVDR
jgi:acyl-CoA thioester hydrolase